MLLCLNFLYILFTFTLDIVCAFMKSNFSIVTAVTEHDDREEYLIWIEYPSDFCVRFPEILL